MRHDHSVSNSTLLHYEREKRDWIRRNPNASHKDYEQAMRSIAKRLGV